MMIAMEASNPVPQYVGFWARAAAALVDTVALLVITWPLLYAIYGMAYFDQSALVAGPADLLLSWVLPAVLVIALWIRFQATPGKMLVRARVVDAASGQPASRGQYVLRYLGYYLALLPLGLGILWVAFDRRKQGWHDKLARTVVVRAPRTAG